MHFWKVSRVPALLRSVCLPFELFARADAVIIARGRFAFLGFRSDTFGSVRPFAFLARFRLVWVSAFWRGLPVVAFLPSSLPAVSAVSVWAWFARGRCRLFSVRIVGRF